MCFYCEGGDFCSKIFIGPIMTSGNLHCEGEPYRLAVYEILTYRQTSCYFLYKIKSSGKLFLNTCFFLTFRDKQSRKDYVNLAKEKNIPVRCFWMKTTHDQAR